MSDLLEAPGKPTLTVHGDVYRVTWTCGIVAELERVAEHRDELSAEVTLYSSRSGELGLLHQARLNLMSTQTRATLARQLADREEGLDWYPLLEGMCFVVRERYRAGDPTIDLREHLPSGRSRWHVEPFLEHGGPTVIYGDGDAGKTLIAIGIAITAASGHPVIGQLHGDPAPILFVDYETDEDTMHERVAAECAGAGITTLPPIFYRRQTASLVEAAATLRSEIAERHAGTVVIDSAGFACGGDPQAADVTLALFRAIRSFGVPTLVIDHIGKNAVDKEKAYGSVYKHNGPRITWRADRTTGEDSEELGIALIPTKRNNGRRLHRRGYRISFENDGDERLRSVRYRLMDLAIDAPEKATLKARILATLRNGPLAVDSLAAELGADDEKAEKTIRSRIGELLKAPDAPIIRLEDRRIALKARESA